MTEQEAISKVQSNRRYYSDTAQFYKKCWGIGFTLFVVTSLCVPIILNTKLDHVSLVASILSGIATLTAMLMDGFKVKEKWVLFRTVSEALKEELELFEGRAKEYGKAQDPIKLLIERTIEIRKAEGRQWAEQVSKNSSSKKKK